MMISTSRPACAASSSRLHSNPSAILALRVAPRRVALPSPSTTPTHHQLNQVCCKAAGSGASSGDDHAGHAVLHDFCMTLPYGTLVGLAGVVAFFVAALKPVAVPLIALGAATLLMAVLSLKGWKQGNASTPYTLVTAGIAGGTAYLTYPHIKTGVTAWLAGGVTALSCAAGLFCLYNVLAGGNPPRKGSK